MENTEVELLERELMKMRQYEIVRIQGGGAHTYRDCSCDSDDAAVPYDINKPRMELPPAVSGIPCRSPGVDAVYNQCIDHAIGSG